MSELACSQRLRFLLADYPTVAELRLLPIEQCASELLERNYLITRSRMGSRPTG
jgi:hypothetical protein